MRTESKCRNTLLTVLIAAMLVTRGVAEPLTILAITGKLILIGLEHVAATAAIALAHSHLAILYAKYKIVKTKVTSVIQKGEKLIELERETRNFVQSLHTQCFQFYIGDAYAQINKSLSGVSAADYAKNFKFLQESKYGTFYAQDFSKVQVLAAQLNKKIMTIESKEINKVSEHVMNDVKNGLSKIQGPEMKAKEAISEAEKFAAVWPAGEDFVATFKQKFEVLIKTKNTIIEKIHAGMQALKDDAEKEQMKLLEAGLQRYADTLEGNLSIDCAFTALYRLTPEGHLKIYTLAKDENLTNGVIDPENDLPKETFFFQVTSQQNIWKTWFPNFKFEPSVFNQCINRFIQQSAVKTDTKAVLASMVTNAELNGTLMTYFYRDVVFPLVPSSVESEGII